MAVTISYSLATTGNLNSLDFTDKVALAALSTGGFVAAGEDPAPGFTDVDLRFYSSAGVAGGFSSGPFDSGANPSVVQLGGSPFIVIGAPPPNVVVAFEHAGQTQFMITDTSGTEVRATTAIGDPDTGNPDVAMIRSTFGFGIGQPSLQGGFVIASDDRWSATDYDIQLNFFRNDGSVWRTTSVDSSVGTMDRDPEVVQLDNGNVAVVWTRELAGGDTQIRGAIYNRDGSVLVRSSFVIDGTGPTNNSPAIVATDYGFAVVYREVTPSNFTPPLATIGSQAIKLVAVDGATGSVLGSKVLTSVSNLFGSLSDPDVVRMADGMLAFSYTSTSGGDADVYARVASQSHTDTTISPAVEIIGNAAGTDDAVRSALANFANTKLAVMYANTTSGRSGGEHLDAWRIHTGDGANDLFTGSTRGFRDSFIGNAGIDTVSYAGETANLFIDLATNTATGGRAEGDRFSGIENLIGGSGNDTLYGDTGANVLNGGAGNDILYGRGGADWFTFSAGNDTFYGGDGTDMISLADAPVGFTMNLGTGTATAGGQTFTFTGIENATGSAAGTDYMTGSAGANLLRGLGGYDWFFGTGGGDTFDGGTGLDMVSYSAAASGVTLDFRTGEGTRGQALGDTYINIERATGTIYDDIFYGSTGSQHFRGLGGNDIFVGSTGGRETYDGGTGIDTVSYSVSTTGVTASLLLGRGTGGDASLDFYISIENLTGSNRNDHLTGDHGVNYLRGGAGHDTILGQGGNDRIYGGSGNDYIDGGVGYDYAFYEGNRAQYNVSTSGGVTTVRYIPGGGDGIDTVLNVEVLRFADGDILL